MKSTRRRDRLHLTTQDPAGKVNIRRGPAMASGDGFSIEVTGKGDTRFRISSTR